MHNVPHSEATKQRLREIENAKVAADPTGYSERMASYRRGKKMPQEAIERIRAFQKKKVFSPETRRKISEAKRGPKHHAWKGGITATNHSERRVFMNSREYKEWRRHVFQRDDYTCQGCGKRGVKLQADHELPYVDYPDLRVEILNGRAMCVDCHKKTPTYGFNQYRLSPSSPMWKLKS